MSSFVMTSNFRSRLRPALGILIKVLLALESSKIATGQTTSNTNPSISSSVATHICKQQRVFQETSQIQTTVKTKPENDDSNCGWYIWNKCLESNSESCPSFDLETCDKHGGGKKKGKGVLGDEEINPDPSQPCDNSTETGLPNPQIVQSISKFPSVVSIEEGDRCQLIKCTGFIVDRNWIIITNYGCFATYSPLHTDFYVIIAGERRLYVEEGTEQRRNMAEYIPHPGFKFEMLSPDKQKYYKDNIGLVRVSAPFEFSENVRPIDLEAIEAIAPSIADSKLINVGWLKKQPMKEDEELRASLIESQLDYIPMDDCYDEQMKNDSASTETLICAGRCLLKFGEENEPLENVLFAQDNSNSGSAPVPVGIGPLRYYPIESTYGVFVNLASYIPWIKETIKGQGESQSTKTSETESASRIIRGEEAPPYKYKSLVNIEEYRSYACAPHSCGGTILNKEWIMTAAHCVAGVPNERLRIVAGDHDISDSDENEQVVEVSKIVVHEDYGGNNEFNDIAVVKVTPPFVFNDKVQNVTLPGPSFETQGPLTAVGWGRTENFVWLHNLRQVEVPFVPLNVCQELYKDSPRTDYRPTENTLCGGDETHGVCKSDSGSPVYHIDQSGDQIVVGIVSIGGSACVLPAVDAEGRFEPDVYVKVAAYYDWIRKNTGMDK